jgi:hypothetical protein
MVLVLTECVCWLDFSHLIIKLQFDGFSSHLVHVLRVEQVVHCLRRNLLAVRKLEKRAEWMGRDC